MVPILPMFRFANASHDSAQSIFPQIGRKRIAICKNASLPVFFPMTSQPQNPVNQTGETPAATSPLRIWLWRAGIVAWLVLMCVALYELRHEWSKFHMKDLDAAMARLGVGHVALAILFTLASYLVNSCVDLVALRWLQRKVPLLAALGSSSVATAFSMNAGGTLLGGGGVRMRLYSAMGLPPGEIARMAGFSMVAGWSGCALVACAFVAMSPGLLPYFSPAWVRVGAFAVMITGAAIGLVLHSRKVRSNDSGHTMVPPTRYLCAAVFLAALDWLLAGMAIRVLLPDDLQGVSTTGFLGAVLVSQFLSAISHVPGGVGVLELSITKLTGPYIPAAWLAAALLLYRAVYYLFPFLLAALALGLREAWAHRKHIARGAGFVGGMWMRMGPRLGPLLALAGGFVLMISANTPMEEARRLWLQKNVPLAFVETSHLLSSVAGLALIIVARGLQRRVRAAWWAAMFLSCCGVVFSLLKGVDYEESITLVILLFCLAPIGGYYHRHSAMFSRRFTLEWWLLLGGLVGVAAWLGFFTSRHVEYQNELWWKFSFDSDASRFLRGQVGVAALLLALILTQFLRRTPPQNRPAPSLTEPGIRSEVAALVSGSPQCQTHLALLGDKFFHFSPSRRSFVMFGEQGNSRIVMGDPVGDEDEWDDLLWSFNERAEDDGRRVCYYQVSAGAIPHYLDMGMRLFKLGEEARVFLPNFELEGAAGAKFRKARNRAERSGLAFEIWEPEKVQHKMNALRRLSDEWLAKHAAKEKFFSLGRFDEEYLTSGPVAVVTLEGNPCAFANLWRSGGNEELSVDLMRHFPDAPGGVMDFLFTELFLWGKQENFRWFNLGMAPLSGMTAHPLAPLWQKLGSLVYQRGGAFYNFRGLREFKEKFHPEWQPRYLAIPGSWHLPAALTDITAIIGGGWKNVIGKNKSS